MAEEDVLNFVAITSADPQKAAQYLSLTDNNLEQAIQLYFDSPNLDFGVAPAASAPSANAPSNVQNPIEIDSDEEMDFDAGAQIEANTPPARNQNVESDEEMARRLQEEMYGGMGGGTGETEVRAPMQRTTETLVGPGSNWGPPDGGDLDDMIQQQLAARRRTGKHC